jgi:hypothetical protein
MRATRLLVVASMGAALVAATATPASAATGYDRCPDLRMCVFTGPNGTGAIAWFAIADADLGDGVGPQGMNNNIESTWNRSGHTWHLYNGAGYTPAPPWYSYPHHPQGGNVIPAAANKVSSLHDA